MSICRSAGPCVGHWLFWLYTLCMCVWDSVRCVLSWHSTVGLLVCCVGCSLPAAVISAVWETQYNTHSDSTLLFSLCLLSFALSIYWSIYLYYAYLSIPVLLISLYLSFFFLSLCLLPFSFSLDVLFLLLCCLIINLVDWIIGISIAINFSAHVCGLHAHDNKVFTFFSEEQTHHSFFFLIKQKVIAGRRHEGICTLTHTNCQCDLETPFAPPTCHLSAQDIGLLMLVIGLVTAQWVGTQWWTVRWWDWNFLKSGNE